jgi:IS30 family transposase
MKQQQSYRRISETELDLVAELQSRGYGVTKIAHELGRSKSSISELIAVNKDKRAGVFRANLAARRRAKRKLRQRKRVKLVVNEQLLLEIYIGMVYLRRSPEQIAN